MCMYIYVCNVNYIGACIEKYGVRESESYIRLLTLEQTVSVTPFHTKKIPGVVEEHVRRTAPSQENQN